MARALVLGTASLPALTGGTNSQKRLEIDYFGENTQPEEDLNGRAEWTFSWQTLAGSALLNGFLKKKKKKIKSFPWPCLPSTSITEARHSDCYLFCHNYYHETSMITALVILLIINSTNAVIHQQRLAALWRRGPYAHG